ncbi:hypothetical protein JCM33374_g6645 [Metschnikowia sp. JCM 33374]|nr:hypothetical protein JCM33374_g6645 [Metschnikowia sp. JCM 33374]
MPSNNSSSHKGARTSATQDETSAMGANSQPTRVPVVFPERNEHLNHHLCVTCNPEQYPPPNSSANVFQPTPRECRLGQLDHLEKEICGSKDCDNYGSGPSYSNPKPRVHSPPSNIFNGFKTTSTTDNLHPNVIEIPSSASPSAHFLTKDSFIESSSNFHANTSANSAHTRLYSSYTGGRRFVPQMDSVEPISIDQKLDPALVQDLQASLSPHSIGSDTYAKCSEDVQESFTRLVPSLQTVHSGTFGTFLIEFLKESHDHVPLKDFYCILYTSDSQEYIRILEREKRHVAHHLDSKWLKGIILQHLVLESFKSPDTFQNGLLRFSPLSTVNFHEFLRNFLAIKILFGFIQKVDDPSQTLPRASIYKAYYIICQKLFLKYPETSKSLCSPQSHILGQARVGILTKLMHPNLVCRRLGKRGQSKSHYIGLTCNESMVDEDTIRLVNLDITDLRDYFKNLSQPAKIKSESRVEVLKGHGVNLDPLIANIFEFVFSGNDQYLISDTVIYSIMVLSNRSSPREAFLHLYLVVLLLIFPVIVASDQEVTMSDKQQLRVAVKKLCYQGLKMKFPFCHAELSHSEGVFKEMAQDIKSLTITASECGDVSPYEELFIKGTINALNAYSHELMANSATVSKMADVTNIHNIGKAFQKVALVATQAMSSIASGITDSELYNDVPYQVFHLSAFFFHEVTLYSSKSCNYLYPVIPSFSIIQNEITAG